VVPSAGGALRSHDPEHVMARAGGQRASIEVASPTLSRLADGRWRISVTVAGSPIHVT